jgi:hypothetical protein
LRLYLLLPDGRTRFRGSVSAYGISCNATAESKAIAREERRPWISDALFAGLAFLVAGRMSRGLLRLVATVVPFVVRQGLRNFFWGKLTLASKMQNIV